MTVSLVNYLEKTADSYPHAEAVVFAGERITYTELYKQARSIAGFLQEQGVQRQERIAILMENSPAYIAAYYGVLIAGAAVVGLNTGTKARDLLNWLKHSGATWLFADARHPEFQTIAKDATVNVKYAVMGQAADLPLLEHAVTWNEIMDSALDPVAVTYKKDDLASIIYTSGTTGHPKGVMLSQWNLAANTQSILDYLGLQHDDSILNILPFYYSYGNSVLHTHIAVGGKMVLENSLAFPHKILSKMAEENVTGFSGVPSTFALLMNRHKFSDYDLSSLRYMTQAGGPMAPANIMRLISELPDIRFFVMYGQTEATARLAYLPAENLMNKMGSIGIGIPGVTLEIRDEQNNILPVGKTGEIYARGENIMLGYWHDKEKTDEVLVGGWLKTGDLAHQDSDGYFFIDGRSSDMIKSGANRISPKEIEEVIAELDDVSEVAVVGIDDELMGQLIKAVIVPKNGRQIHKATVLRHCKDNLAMYKVPKQIEFVEEIPKTASGKVRRFMLKDSAG